jgi:hypothetical protein
VYQANPRDPVVVSGAVLTMALLDLAASAIGTHQIERGRSDFFDILPTLTRYLLEHEARRTSTTAIPG